MPRDPIVVAVDEQPQTRLALEVAGQVAERLERPLVLVAVYETERWFAYVDASQYVERGRRHAEELLAELTTSGADTRVVGAPSAPHGLQQLVEEQHAALLVLGASHHDGVARRLAPGGTAERMLNGAPCPLLVAAGPMPARGAVVVAYDDTPEADAALQWAVSVAAALGCPLALWHVTARTAPPGHPGPYREFTEYIHGIAQRMLDRGLERLPAGRQATTLVMEGDPGEELAARASAEGAAMIVCGSRGFGPARALLMGRTARSLFGHARSPVVVVPRPGEASDVAAPRDR